MTTPDRDLLTRLWGELRALVAPLELAAASPAQRAALADRLGWDLAALGTSLGVGDLTTIDAQVDEWISAVDTAVDTVEQALAGGAPDSLDDLAELGRAAGKAVASLRGLPQPWRDATLPDPGMLTRMGGDLLDHLADRYLAERAPVLRRVLALLGIVIPAEEAAHGVAEPAGAAPVRLPVRRVELHPELIGALLRDPVGTLRQVYGWTGGESAAAVADKLFPRLAALCADLGLDAWYGAKPGAGADPGAWSAELAAHMLTIRGEVGRGAARAEWGVSIALSTDALGGLGLVVVPHGEIALAAALGGWNLSAALGAGGAAFAISGSGLTVDGGGTEVDLAVELAKRKAGDEPAFRFGAAGGTRLEVDEFAVRAFAAFRADGDHDFGIGVEAGSAALVVQPGADADSFLNHILPAGGLRVAIEAGLAWSRRGGLTLSGGAGLEAALPVRLALGPITVEGVKLALTASADDRGLRALATADVRFALGPVLGVIDDIGVAAALTFPEGGGNLGPADAAVSLARPKGIALRVESAVVTGAGFLSIDHDNGRYAGGVDLEFAKLRLSALGLLTTKMPGGKPGFSLLVLVNARFPQPLPLGFGFNLASVGGLLGINRSVDVARMRAGLRSGALTALLAPGEAVGRDASLLSDLEGLFPVTPGRFVFGPTARITWGAPTIVTADLGLALELPNPVRLLVAGRVRVALPDERAPLVLLNLDALGVLDFGAGSLSVDASLYDSQVAGMPLTGDMALRAAWSGGGEFALSVGGFHPRYTPPAGFPALRPVSLAVGGGSVRAQLSAYLALTANTLQLGAKADLHASAAGFTAEGRFSFDTLVQFAPFGFEVDLAVAVAVRWQGKLLMGIAADLYLRGPAQWHVRGQASVRLLFFKATLRFDATFGTTRPVPAVPGEDVAALVRAALAEPGAWSVEERAAGPAAVTLRPGANASGLLVSPAARIVARQKVAPVGGTALDRFGQAPVLGDRSVSIDSASLGGAATATETVRDPFPAAQFRDMSDEEKLTQPSFDAMPSGVAFSATEALVFDQAGPAAVAIGYRTHLVDAPDTGLRAGLVAPGIAIGDTPTKPLPGKPLPGKPLPDEPLPGPFPPDRPGKPLPLPDPLPAPEPDPLPTPEPDPVPVPDPQPEPGPVPEPEPQPPVADWVLDGGLLDLLATAGAAGRAATRDSGAERFTGGPALPVLVAEEGYLVVSATRLVPTGPRPWQGERWSRSEALDRLRRHRAEHPNDPEQLIVLSAAEAARPEGTTR